MGEHDRWDGTGVEGRRSTHETGARSADWLTALWAGRAAVEDRPAEERGPSGTDGLGTDRLGTDRLPARWADHRPVDPATDGPGGRLEQEEDVDHHVEDDLSPMVPAPGEDLAADAARHRRLAAWSAVARARTDVAVAEAVLARDTGTDQARWEADAVVAEEIHVALVAAREEARHHRRRRPDLVGLELAERLALERLGCDAYEDLVAGRAEREAAPAPSATDRDDRDIVALDDMAAVELARAELQEAIAAWHDLDDEDLSRAG